MIRSNDKRKGYLNFFLPKDKQNQHCTNILEIRTFNLLIEKLTHFNTYNKVLSLYNFNANENPTNIF